MSPLSESIKVLSDLLENVRHESINVVLTKGSRKYKTKWEVKFGKDVLFIGANTSTQLKIMIDNFASGFKYNTYLSIQQAEDFRLSSLYARYGSKEPEKIAVRICEQFPSPNTYINCIKLLREAVPGLGLCDAKNMIDKVHPYKNRI